MTTNPKVGDRVVHLAHGIGTVLERDGDEVLVELDGVPGKPHTFLLSRGTLRMEGEPAGDMKPPSAASTAAERREIFTPAATGSRIVVTAPDACSTAVAPAKAAKTPEVPMADTLLTELNHEITKRGRGAIRDLAKTLHMHDASIHGWRSSGSIPEARRDGVRAWIDAGVPEHHPTAAQKAKAAVEKKPAKPSKRAKAPKALQPRAPARPGTAPKTSTVPAHVIQRVLDSLGLRTCEVWVAEGDVMRRAQAVVLPG